LAKYKDYDQKDGHLVNVMWNRLVSVVGNKMPPCSRKRLYSVPSSSIRATADSIPVRHGLFSKEKDVALSISLKLGKALHQAFPELKIVYTRTTDIMPGQ
jgi:hypothetical protein